MIDIRYVLKRPLLSEKVTDKTDKYGTYAFEVHKNCNKYVIKEAIEQIYNVKVLKVNTCITPGKIKRAGRKTKKTSSTKKAYVKLSSDQKIEFFKGV